jgi:hypothetical protein
LKSLARITFPEPEKACVYCFVGRLPNAGNAGVILKVLSHPWKMLYRGYTEALQISLVANSGLHQHLRRMDCTQRQNHLSSDTDTLDFAVASYFYSRYPRARKDQSRDQGVGEHGQVWSIHVRKSIRAKDRKALPISNPPIGKSAAADTFHHATVVTVEGWNANRAYTLKRRRDDRVSVRRRLDKEETTGATAIWVWSTVPVFDPPIDLQQALGLTPDRLRVSIGYGSTAYK